MNKESRGIKTYVKCSSSKGNAKAYQQMADADMLGNIKKYIGNLLSQRLS